MSSTPSVVTRIADGAYRIERGDRSDVIYVAGDAGKRWIFWNGQIWRENTDTARTLASRTIAPSGPETVRAPMPARVLALLVQPGAAVKKGDTLVLLEAMKMELPLRAPIDGTVAAVHCQQGDLVNADAALVELG